MNVTVLDNSKGAIINLNGDLKNDLSTVFVRTSFYFTSPMNPTKFVQGVNYTIEVCNILSTNKRNFLLKVIMQNFAAHSNFRLQCPFKKGHYAAND